MPFKRKLTSIGAVAAAVFALLSSSVDAVEPSIVTTRLEIKLDSHPDETAWEIRGPLPSIALVDYIEYDTYERGNVHVAQNIDLEAGMSYYLLLTDYGDDGIKDGGFKLFAELTEGDIILEEGDGDIKSGKVYTFTVPVGKKAKSAPIEKNQQQEKAEPTAKSVE